MIFSHNDLIVKLINYILHFYSITEMQYRYIIYKYRFTINQTVVPMYNNIMAGQRKTFGMSNGKV